MKRETAKERPSKVKAGRPRSEEKRVAILHAGANLFFEKGLDRTSMDAVAQEAGVSKQTVYSHFASKEELLEACIRSKLDAYELRSSGALEHLDVREGLITLGERYIALLYDGNALRMHRTVVGNAVSHPELAQLFFEAGPRETFETFEGFIGHHADHGSLAVHDVHEAAEMLTGMLGSHTHLKNVLGLENGLGEDARRSRATRCVEVFLSHYGIGES